MKKLLLFPAAVILFASCSSNSDDAVINMSEVKLVEATLNVTMNENAPTRSYLGKAEADDNGNTYVNHFFENSDEFLVCDYAGQWPFTVTDGHGQTTSITGRWAEVSNDAVMNGITIVVPKSAAKEKAITVADECPTMHMSLATEQTTRYKQVGKTGHEITYQQDAGLSFCCNTKKQNNLTFFPIVTFLYFKSKYPDCVVCGTSIAGDTYDVTYSGRKTTGTNPDGTDHFYTVEGMSAYLTFSANANSILCHGYTVEGGHLNDIDEFDGYYEYVVCIRPGHYDVGDFKIYYNRNSTTIPEGVNPFSNKDFELDFYAGYLYYFGCIDPVTE